MLSPTRASPDTSQNEELLRTAKSLRLRFADDKPVSIDAPLSQQSQQASDTKKHTTIPFAPFRASYGNLAGIKSRGTGNQGHPGYSGLDHMKQNPYEKAPSDSFARDAVSQEYKGYNNNFDYTKQRRDGFSPYARNAVSNNTGHVQERRKNGSYNGAHSMSDLNHMGIEQQYRQERGYPQDYRSSQPQQSYYSSPQPYVRAQQYHADPRQPHANPQQPHGARRSRSRSPSPEPPVVAELEERYHKLRLALHSKAVDGFEKVEKELTDEVAASVNAIFDPVAQLDQKFRQVLAPLSDGEAQLNIVSTQENGEDSQRCQTVQISGLVNDFERVLANGKNELSRLRQD